MELARSAVWNQHKVLYIIKPQGNARWCVMRYSPAGADDIHDCVVMICQACGLDKKILVPKNEDFLSRDYEKDIFGGYNKVSNFHAKSHNIINVKVRSNQTEVIVLLCANNIKKLNQKATL